MHYRPRQYYVTVYVIFCEVVQHTLLYMFLAGFQNLRVSSMMIWMMDSLIFAESCYEEHFHVLTSMAMKNYALVLLSCTWERQQEILVIMSANR